MNLVLLILLYTVINMSWYASIKEANKAAKRKTKEFNEEFIVVADKDIPRCYLAIKKVLADYLNKATPSQSNRDR